MARRAAGGQDIDARRSTAQHRPVPDARTRLPRVALSLGLVFLVGASGFAVEVVMLWLAALLVPLALAGFGETLAINRARA